MHCGERATGYGPPLIVDLLKAHLDPGLHGILCPKNP